MRNWMLLGALAATGAMTSQGVGAAQNCTDLTKPGFCHRRVFAEWWHGQTGITVPELGDHQ